MLVISKICLVVVFAYVTWTARAHSLVRLPAAATIGIAVQILTYLTGSTIVISPYAENKDSLKWMITSNITVNGWSLYAFAGVEPGNYISVLDGDTGLVVGPDPAAAREIKPLTYRCGQCP